MREPNKWTRFFTTVPGSTWGEQQQFSLAELTVQGGRLEQLPGTRSLGKRLSTTPTATLKLTLLCSFCFLGNVHHVTPDCYRGVATQHVQAGYY